MAERRYVDPPLETEEEILVGALEKDADEQVDFVVNACRGNPDQVAAVLSLLSTACEGESYFSDYLQRTLTESDSVPAFQLGPYRIVDLIGEGGMGRVYRAERIDGQFEKQVAVKLLAHRHMGSAAQERFRHERQILAALVHPGICRLLDGGTAADGSLYFVMDLVAGVPIDQYCWEAGLRKAEILELLLQVCAAVGFAHQELVLHRDLKPSNILVGEDGRAQLLDFGVAELLREDAQSPSVCEVGMTPRFASPEALRGDRLSTASDVYSLGVIARLLLTGSPSRKDAEPGGLDDDLRRILAAATAEDLSSRYATVSMLARDIESYLQRRPVSVRHATLLYRTQCAIRRRPMAAALSLMTAVLIIALSVVSTYAAIEKARQVGRIKKERDRVHAIKEFTASVVRGVHPAGMGPVDPPASAMLMDAAARLNRDTTMDAASRAEIMTVIAESLMALRGVSEAQPKIDFALALAEEAVGTDHPLYLSALAVRHRSQQLPGGMLAEKESVKALPERMAHVGGVSPHYEVMALLNRAFLAIQEWDHPEALKIALKAVALAEETLGALDTETLSAILLASVAADVSQQKSLALALAEEASERVRQLKLPTDHLLTIRTDIVHGQALFVSHDISGGLAQMRDAVSRLVEVFGERSQDAAVAQYDLARYLRRAGHLGEAIAHHRSAIVILKDQLGSQDEALITMQANLTRLLIESRRPDEMDRAASVFLENVSDASRTFPYHVDQDSARVAKALALAYEGQMETARGVLQSVSPDRKNLRPGTMLDPVYAAAVIRRLQGDHQIALVMQLQTLDSMRKGAERARNIMHVLTEIGLNHLELGSPESAATVLEQALVHYRRNQVAVTPRHADALLGLGRAYLILGKPERGNAFIQCAAAFWGQYAPASEDARVTDLWLSEISTSAEESSVRMSLSEGNSCFLL